MRHTSYRWCLWCTRPSQAPWLRCVDLFDDGRSLEGRRREMCWRGASLPKNETQKEANFSEFWHFSNQPKMYLSVDIYGVIFFANLFFGSLVTLSSHTLPFPLFLSQAQRGHPRGGSRSSWEVSGELSGREVYGVVSICVRTLACDFFRTSGAGGGPRAHLRTFVWRPRVHDTFPRHAWLAASASCDMYVILCARCLFSKSRCDVALTSFRDVFFRTIVRRITPP